MSDREPSAEIAESSQPAKNPSEPEDGSEPSLYVWNIRKLAFLLLVTAGFYSFRWQYLVIDGLRRQGQAIGRGWFIATILPFFGLFTISKIRLGLQRVAADHGHELSRSMGDLLGWYFFGTIGIHSFDKMLEFWAANGMGPWWWVVLSSLVIQGFFLSRHCLLLQLDINRMAQSPEFPALPRKTTKAKIALVYAPLTLVWLTAVAAVSFGALEVDGRVVIRDKSKPIVAQSGLLQIPYLTGTWVHQEPPEDWGGTPDLFVEDIEGELSLILWLHRDTALNQVLAFRRSSVREDGLESIAIREHRGNWPTKIWPLDEGPVVTFALTSYTSDDGPTTWQPNFEVLTIVLPEATLELIAEFSDADARDRALEILKSVTLHPAPFELTPTS